MNRTDALIARMQRVPVYGSVRERNAAAIDAANGVVDAPKLAAEIVRIVEALGPKGLAKGGPALAPIVEQLAAIESAASVPDDAAPMRARRVANAAGANERTARVLADIDRRMGVRGAAQPAISRDPVTGRLSFSVLGRR